MEIKKVNQVRSSDKNIPSLTPRQLIKRHMDHPDVPITDDDLNNMNLGLETGKKGGETAAGEEMQLSAKEKAGADELADEIGSNDTGMAYKADF